MATNIYTVQDHKGNKVINADLTQIPIGNFPSGIGGGAGSGGVVQIIAGDGIVVTDNGDGTVTVSAAPPAQLKVEAYSQRFTVTDPLAQTVLRATHAFGTTQVAVTVMEVGPPSIPVKAQVQVVNENSVDVLLTGETAGEFDVLVFAGISPSGTP